MCGPKRPPDSQSSISKSVHRKWWRAPFRLHPPSLGDRDRVCVCVCVCMLCTTFYQLCITFC